MVLGCEVAHTEPRFVFVLIMLFICRLLHTVTIAGVVNARHVGSVEMIKILSL